MYNPRSRPFAVGLPQSSSSQEVAGCSSADANVHDSHMETVDPVEDMYNILEGSALIPFAEVKF